METKIFESSEGNVWKYVFTGTDYIAESVLYKYNDFMERTVICCSTQSGCPVGCKFCGTGNKFIRNLTSDEIVNQIHEVLRDKGLEFSIIESSKFQIMFMSMGEPMLNWKEVRVAISRLHNQFPNADLLLSTIGINDDSVLNEMINISKYISKVGIQFSVHKSNDWHRNKLIPYKNKMNLKKIRDFGILWWKETGRKIYLNYCIDGTNSTQSDFESLTDLFSPLVFNFTFSVVCSADETMKDAGYNNLDEIQAFQSRFSKKGYDTRIFDPAGKDDIGGGCGQLWYVQDWLKEY